MKFLIETLRAAPILVGIVIGGIISIILIEINSNPDLNKKIANSQYSSLIESRSISVSSKLKGKKMFYYIRPNIDNICLLGKNDKVINLLKGEIYSEFDYNIKKVFTCEYLNKNVEIIKKIQAQEYFHVRIFLITMSLTSIFFYFIGSFLRKKKNQRGE